MSHPLPRFMPPVEVPERREKIETFEPETYGDYLALEQAITKTKAFIGLLNIMEKVISEMGPYHADELGGCLPNIRVFDLEDDIRAAVKHLRELEAGKRAGEQRP